MASNQITVSIKGVQGLGLAYDAAPETISRLTEIFQAAVADLEPKQTVRIVQESPQTRTQYALVVFERNYGLGAGRFYSAELNRPLEEASRYAEKVYGIHIIRRNTGRGLLPLCGLNERASIIEEPKMGVTEGNFCFYLPEEGHPASQRPPFDFVARFPEEHEPDPFMKAVADKLISADFAYKLLNPPRVVADASLQSNQKTGNWKTVGIILGALAGTAAVIGVLAALVFFGAPMITAAAAGTFVALASGKIAIGAFIATAMLGMGCFLACRS